MNGIKKTRNVSSMINQNQGGGPKKMGFASTVGRNSNLFFRIIRTYGTPGLIIPPSKTIASANIGSVLPHPRQS
jgi:hypothetical protein